MKRRVDPSVTSTLVYRSTICRPESRLVTPCVQTGLEGVFQVGREVAGVTQGQLAQQRVPVWAVPPLVRYTSCDTMHPVGRCNSLTGNKYRHFLHLI